MLGSACRPVVPGLEIERTLSTRIVAEGWKSTTVIVELDEDRVDPDVTAEEALVGEVWVGTLRRCSEVIRS